MGREICQVLNDLPPNLTSFTFPQQLGCSPWIEDQLSQTQFTKLRFSEDNGFKLKEHVGILPKTLTKLNLAAFSETVDEKFISLLPRGITSLKLSAIEMTESLVVEPLIHYIPGQVFDGNVLPNELKDCWPPFLSKLSLRVSWAHWKVLIHSLPKTVTEIIMSALFYQETRAEYGSDLPRQLRRISVCFLEFDPDPKELFINLPPMLEYLGSNSSTTYSLKELPLPPNMEILPFSLESIDDWKFLPPGLKQLEVDESQFESSTIHLTDAFMCLPRRLTSLITSFPDAPFEDDPTTTVTPEAIAALPNCLLTFRWLQSALSGDCLVNLSPKLLDLSFVAAKDVGSEVFAHLPRKLTRLESSFLHHVTPSDCQNLPRTLFGLWLNDCIELSSSEEDPELIEAEYDKWMRKGMQAFTIN